MKNSHDNIVKKNIGATQTSFINRVSLVAAVVTGVLLLALTMLMGSQSRDMMRENVEQTAFNQLDYINLEIGSVLSDVSSSVANIAPMVVRELGKANPDSAQLAYLISQVADNDQKVQACCLSLEPGVMKGRQMYSLYAADCDSGIVVSQIASDDFYYFSMDWYLIPMRLDDDYWSDPYVSAFGTRNIIVTYSIPLHDREGRHIGVLCADVNVSYFTRYLKENTAYEHAYNVMIGEDASYIVHPNVNNVLSNTIFTLHSEPGDSLWRQVGLEMLAGHVGKATIDENGYKWLVFYAPIKGVGWSAAIVCSTEDVYRSTTSHMRIFYLLGLLSIFVVTLVVRILVRRIAQPVEKMAEAARTIAGGKFDAELPRVTTRDELRDLHDSLKQMQESLASYFGQIQHNAAVQQRMDSEMDMARNIQLGMLPQFSDDILTSPYIDLSAVLRPAKMVGGDLYDFYLIGNRLPFMVADVSGKGFPASLLMVETRSMLRSIVYTVHSPAQLLSYINTAILETNKANMFVTMFIGFIDLDTGELTYSNAGHNPPLVLHPDGEVHELQADPNLPLGSIDGYEFIEQSTTLAPGDLIFAYTDGISEAENRDHELFGIDNIIATLSTCTAVDARRTIETIDTAIRAHVGTAPQADDITSLAIRYHHPATSPKPYYTSLSFSTLGEMNNLNTFVEELGERFRLDPETVMNLNLALEEMVVNVLKYAHPGDSVPHPFDMLVRVADHVMEFTLIDDGIPFDPTAAREVDIDKPIEERTIGGLGILLARQIMDSMHYSRRNKHNVLTMTKRYTPGH